MENYYEILEVNKNASSEIISKVFKYHIKKNHPDLFSGEEKLKAEAKVQKLNEAYEVLSNPEKRKIYDTSLEEFEKEKVLEQTNKIKLIQNQNTLLNHRLNNYNKFIYDYFYERAPEVFAIIDNYDNTAYNVNKRNNNTLKNIVKKYLSIVSVYIIMILAFLFAISHIFNINIFKIIFDTFLTK